MTIAASQCIPSQGTLEAVLVPIHDRWLNEIRTFVEAATSPSAGFWDRWAAVRYLADQFRDHFKLERALLASIARLLRPEDAQRLTIQTEELEDLLSELDRTGRRRGTGPAVAEEARRLMGEIAIWCAELELAASALRRDAISPEAVRALEHVMASGAIAFP